MSRYLDQADQRRGDEGVREESLLWYAVQTAPRHEKRVSAELTAKEIECFLPTITRDSQWTDRRKTIVEPLFAGYVFVRLALASPTRIVLLRTGGVVGMVGIRGAGTPIPDEEINAIQRVLEAGAKFAPHPYLEVGQRVRIRGGALDGLEGILQAMKGDHSLIVSVELIHRSIAVTISGYHVFPVAEIGKLSSAVVTGSN